MRNPPATLMTGQPPTENDTTHPHPARRYDGHLGDKDNHPGPTPATRPAASSSPDTGR
ncbi:hypothetical protein ACIQOU_32370 [Streptomyces sp. NPDC091279]|uniref:hypothetical protein n=1 Tax=unclassified Streptomyces TaxID=2593676 RepID=UPI0037F300A6